MKPENLRKLRMTLGLTKGKVAEDMLISRPTVDHLEDGSAKPATLQYYELYLKEERRKRLYAKEHRL